MYFRVSDRVLHRLVNQKLTDDAPSRAALLRGLEVGLKGQLVCNAIGALEFSSPRTRDHDKLIDAVVKMKNLTKSWKVQQQESR